MDWQTKVGIAQVVAAAIPGIATVVLATLAYLHSRRTQQLQAMNFYIGNWREMNRLFLQNDRARSVRAVLVDQVASDQNDLHAVVAIYINQALLAYYSWKFKVLALDELEEEFRSIWEILSHRQDVAVELLSTDSYPKKFTGMFLGVKPKPPQQSAT